MAGSADLEPSSSGPAAPSDPAGDADLFDRAQAWIDADPDPASRAELTALVAAARAEATGSGGAGSSGSTMSAAEAALPELRDRMSGPLEFGTAGLRGTLGAGPHRMNRAVVLRAAAGLLAYLRTRTPTARIVIGYDARHGSRDFALATAAVAVAGGGEALLLPRPLPTPVLAYAIRTLAADAGVMVTASHNPAADNGYKVYLGDGMQIVPPADALIADAIAGIGPAREVPQAAHGWRVLGDDLETSYVAACAGLVAPGSPRAVSVVHTALHGVGDRTVRAAFAAAGFPEPIRVAEQAEPDPDFPTVAFPNPEEPGALDAALALAARERPDVVIANDPDADRCAVALPTGSGWRVLRGDELGVLLAAHLIARGIDRADCADIDDEADNGVAVNDVDADAEDAPRPVLATSIVSSRLLGALAADAGLAYAQTLTGFKWIARVPGLRFGYEEALGYCVAPRAVRDKDGIATALLVAELVATARAAGRSPLDTLDDLARRHGVYATDAFSVRVPEVSLIGQIMTRLRQITVPALGGEPVIRVDDLALGGGGLPPTEGLRFMTARDSRVIVRPSGTEPKLKVYAEVIEPVGAPDEGEPGEDPAGDSARALAQARSRAASRLAAIRETMTALTAADG